MSTEHGRPLGGPVLEESADDLYEHAPCGYLSMLPDSRIVKVNRTFLSWTGYTRDALVGRMRFHDLLTAGGRIFYETHLAPLLRMQGFVREIALDLVCADGSHMPILVNAAWMVPPSNAPAIVRATIFDATERRRYERELLQARNRAEEAAEARARLIAMISHDLRAPLTAILTATALLEKSEPSERQKRFVQILRSSSDQALALVNSILDFGRLEAGQIVLRERVFDVAQLVHGIVSGIKLTAERKPDLAVQADVDDRIPPQLVGDPDRLAQILNNLLTNAVKFTHQGVVSLVLGVHELDDERVALDVVVSDTGIGIPPDRLPHIFDEYTQATADIGEKYGGAGLGLAITQKLLSLHGSTLHVASTVGQGTTCSFVVHLKRPTADLPGGGAG